jgi:hypothetical protein
VFSNYYLPMPKSSQLTSQYSIANVLMKIGRHRASAPG